MAVRAGESLSAVDLFDAKHESQSTLISNIQRLLEINNTVEDEGTSGTIRARFSDISNLTPAARYSQSINVAEMEWALYVCTSMKEDKKYFSVYLEMMSKNIPKPWLSPVHCTFMLLSQNSEKKRKTLKAVFSSEIHPSWGLRKFINFEDLVRESNGYVKDDSILLQMDLTVFPKK
ncbi:hypothetical protein PENTCL1PPCAC_23910 [Pristionchus entomophagus]|uniref:MATH domain-containing protein n=1 Tax=Pristionchus entomophagus TaxID=358040 RepID=A0AAV5U4C1_9BILA|nr:hypothetical protein PENTCL1PPCAC_23910 [Pristionchus entomophagus]